MNGRTTWVGVAALFAVSMTGCKLKLEGKVTGLKEGSSDTVIVHVVSEKDTDLMCMYCKPQPVKVPASGEIDIEYDLTMASSKTVLIAGKKGLKKGQLIIDVSANMPAKLTVDPAHGLISCQPRECSGGIDLVPSPKVFLKTEPGAVLQIGSDKLTAGADGAIMGPLNLAFAPPLEKQRLDKICVGSAPDQSSPTIVTTPMNLTFPDTSTSSTRAELQLDVVQKNLAKHLANVMKGPVLFAWEKPGQPARGKRAAVFVDGDDCYDAGAPDATVADLDVIAVADSKTRTGECSYKSASSTATGKITMYDLHATVYDRITGKKLGDKLFPAPKDCLDGFSAKVGTTIAPGTTSYVDKEGVAKWAASFAR